MFSKIGKYAEIVLEDGGGLEVVFRVETEDFSVLLALVGESLPGLRHFVVIMNGLDGLLEADGDDEAKDDGGDVDEEVSPGVSGVFGRVYVEHWALLLLWTMVEIGGRAKSVTAARRSFGEVVSQVSLDVERIDQRRVAG